MTSQDEAEEVAVRDATWAAACRRTTLLANLAVVMERTDECESAVDGGWVKVYSIDTT